MKRKIWIVLLCCVLLLPPAVYWVLWANTAPVLTQYDVTHEALPDSFDGLRIAQVSDLHNAAFGENNEEILNLLRQAQPDIIAITGDLIDSRNTDIRIALAFVREAVKIAPCYYVTGNHEQRIAQYETLEQGMLEAGVTVLRNDSRVLERNGESIRIMGVDDCTFYAGTDGNAQVRAMEKEIVRMQSDAYTVLLAHRPELAVVYDRYDLDLVLCGHAHGGQIRLPFIGGLFAPDQGFFPKYTKGVYELQDLTMVVSAGLGNSIFPLRFCNRPEIVVVTLKGVTQEKT